MKTYLRDYSIEGTALVKGCSQLEEVIGNRQEKFMVTVEYQEAKEKAMAALKEIESLLPGEYHRVIGKMEDSFFGMMGICFSAAYRDGMSDLMAAMTFNKIGITNIEYFDFSSKGA